MKKKMKIIGAGIAGLSAGCYALMNGYDTEIFEMHDLPGGMCTGWKRKGYTFDGCIHWLVGSNPQSMIHSSWKEVGALDGKEFVSFDYTMIIEGADGRNLVMYSDADRLEQHLLEFSPDDSTIIKEFINAIRDFGIQKMDSIYLAKFMRMRRDEFVGMFKDPFLKEVFSGFNGPFALIFRQAFYHMKDAGYPIGGSLEFAKGIENRFKALGGKIHYHKKVQKIIVKDHQVTGVILEDGNTYPADCVLSCADGYNTLFRMLGEEYLTEDIRSFYKNTIPVPSSVQVSLGINCDLSDEPYSIHTKIKAPVHIGGTEITHLDIRHYCYDKTLYPPGKSVVISLIHSDYNTWEKISHDKGQYKLEKEKMAQLVQQAVEDRFPQVRGKVEMVDVATPLTYTRYTGVLKGGYMGWMNPAGNIPNGVPGLNGFYMAGQWLHRLSGLPTAVMSAKECVSRICRDDGREFIVKV